MSLGHSLDRDDRGLLNYEYLRDNPEQLDDPSWQVGLPQSIIDDIKESLRHPEQLTLLSDSLPNVSALARSSATLESAE